MSSTAPASRQVRFSESLSTEKLHEGPSLSSETRLLNVLGRCLQSKIADQFDGEKLMRSVVTLFSGINSFKASDSINQSCPDVYGSAILIRQALHQFWDRLEEGIPGLETPNCEESRQVICRFAQDLWRNKEEDPDDEEEMVAPFDADAKDTLLALLFCAMEEPQYQEAFRNYWEDLNREYSPPPLQTKLKEPLRSILKKTSPDTNRDFVLPNAFANAFLGLIKGEMRSRVRSHLDSYTPGLRIRVNDVAIAILHAADEHKDWATLDWLLEQPCYRKIDPPAANKPADEKPD